MDENKSTRSTRVTRSRRTSTENATISSVATPKKKTRSRKMNDISEKEATESVDSRSNKDDNFDDVASNASSDSVRSCKVMLMREKYDDITGEVERRAIAHSTRGRRSSHLTEENLAAHSNTSESLRRSLRSASVASDGSDSTHVSRTRSSNRLINSQNTPRKETVVRPTTPARRSSRLLSENEKSADSPVKTATPGRRNLRSNSVISAEDTSPTMRRTTSRLNESQGGTPKALKTIVNKLKESITPRRGSMRINKSLIATDIIDEEPFEEEVEATKANNVDKSKQKLKSDQTVFEENEEEELNEQINAIKNASQREIRAEDEPTVIPFPQDDIKPILTEEQKLAAEKCMTSSNDLIKSPRTPKLANKIAAPPSPVILFTITTETTPKSATPSLKAQTPTMEPAEPMEVSMTEVVSQSPKATANGTPKAKNIVKIESKIPMNSPKPAIISSDLDTMDVTGMVNENILSPVVNKQNDNNVTTTEVTEMESELNVEAEQNTSKNNDPRTSTDFEPMDMDMDIGVDNENILSTSANKETDNNVANTEITDMEIEVNAAESKQNSSKLNESMRNISTANMPRNEPRISSDFDIETAPAADSDEKIGENLKTYPSKVLESVKYSDMSTPKSKTRTSNAFESLDVSALVDEDKVSKKSSKRQSINDSIGFDRMEVSILAEESSRQFEKVKTNTPNAKESSKIKGTPLKDTPSRLNTPKSRNKTPKKDVVVDESVSVHVNETFETNESEIENLNIGTSDLLRPPRHSTFGGMSVSLSEAINKIVGELDHSVMNKDIDSCLNEIVENATPIDEKDIDQQFNEIVGEVNAQKTENNEKNKDADQSINVNETIIEEINVSVVNETIQESNATIDDNVLATATPTSKASTVEDASSSIKPNEEPISGVTETDEKQTEETTTLENSAVAQVQQMTESPQNDTVSSLKSTRKSVQIMTPKVNKAESNLKRIDTPYPDEKSILEATLNHAKAEEKTKKREEERAKAREELKKLRDSWNKSIKRSSLSNDSTHAIDTMGIADTSSKTEEAPLKKMPARNNWGISKGLVDSESEYEDELVPDSEEGSEYENIQDEKNDDKNEFIDDGAEVIEDYESGDSMDEEERREIEENAIEDGLDIGSEDTDDEEEEDEYEDDGFVINEEDLTDASSSEEEDENENDTEEEEEEEAIEVNQAKRRLSRVLESSTEESADEIEIESENNGSNDAVSVTFEQVESVVVINGNPPNAVKLIEGKTFSTTFFMPDEETETTKKPEVIQSKAKTDSIESEKEEKQNKTIDSTVEEELPSKVEEGVVEQETNIETNQTVEIAEKVSETADSDKKTEETLNENVDKDTSLQQSAIAPKVQFDEKENQSVPKKIAIKERTSLPDTERLQKISTSKKSSRVSLSDLNPNAQHLTVAHLKTQTGKTKIGTVDKQVKAKRQSTGKNEENDDLNASTSSVSLSKKKNATLINSPQEEENNNNEKASKNDEVAEQTKSDEISSAEKEAAAAAAAAVATVEEVVEDDHGTVTSTSMLDKEASANKSKLKRKFADVDFQEEVYVPPKQKKILRIINSASGKFIEEPMTPEKKNKYGFKEAPRTPVNPHFKVQKCIQNGRMNNKRKSVYLNEDDDMNILLPRPKWQIKTQFDDIQPKKRQRKLDLGSTEVIFEPWQSKKTTKRAHLVPAELVRYRQNMLHRAGIPRQNSIALLRERQKKCDK